MKYKLAQPEDFKEVEVYEYKVINAYSKLYSDFLTLLVHIDTCIDMYKENKEYADHVMEHLEKEIKQFKP